MQGVLIYLHNSTLCMDPAIQKKTNHFKYIISQGDGDFVVNCFLYLGRLRKDMTLLLTNALIFSN